MEDITKRTYLQFIEKFKWKRIGVLGDLMLDVYFTGNCSRISPEAPVPVVDVNQKKYCLGGAGNVAANLKALGCKVFLGAVTGLDEGADALFGLLKKAGIETDAIVCDKQRATLVKTRVMTAEQCLIRVDEGDCAPLQSTVERNVIQKLEAYYHACDALLIADYNKGFMTERVLETLQKLSSKDPKFIGVDSKKVQVYKALKPTLIKPNYDEFTKLVDAPWQQNVRIEQVKTYGHELYRKCNAEIAAVTLDRDGAALFYKDQFVYYAKAPMVVSPKVSGAGDTFIAAFLLSSVVGAGISASAEIALEAAKIAVEKENTAICSKTELKSAFSKEVKPVSHRTSLRDLCDFYRGQGKRIVFTNGCFDILHRGHIEYLNQAKKLGDVLMVGINNDDSIKRLKGAQRPINTLKDRMEVLAALGCVDHVFSFGFIHDDTPISLIKIIKPHVFVKGGDYQGKLIPELKVLKAFGAKIEFIPVVPNLSTSNIINKISSTPALTIAKTG